VMRKIATQHDARGMHEVLVLTVIHILPEGETVIGLDPLARFTQGLAHAIERHPDAARAPEPKQRRANHYRIRAS
jgi:hypothetical protein